MFVSLEIEDAVAERHCQVVVAGRLKRLLQTAGVRERACMEGIDYRYGRGLDRSEVVSQSLCNWMRHGIHVVVTGPTASGKMWPRCTLWNQSCRQGQTVTFPRFSPLLEKLSSAKQHALARVSP